MLFFDGSERKIEIAIDDKKFDLRTLGAFWHELVQASGASILSSTHSRSCDAHLLSESSLFVWPDRFTMITCGQTKLIDSVLYFLQHFDQDPSMVFYQCKNELWPDQNPIDFQAEIQALQENFAGSVYSLGKKQSNNIFFFEASANDSRSQKETTTELLMYGIQEPASCVFLHPSADRIRKLLSKSGLYDTFQIDDFVFQPVGYSVNGLSEHGYFTLHVTPQQERSYASFETNISLEGGAPTIKENIIEILLSIFNPHSFDIVLCTSKEQNGLLEIPNAPKTTVHKLGQSHAIQLYQQEPSYPKGNSTLPPPKNSLFEKYAKIAL